MTNPILHRWLSPQEIAKLERADELTRQRAREMFLRSCRERREQSPVCHRLQAAILTLAETVKGT